MALGGSIVFPKEIDVEFIKEFRDLIQEEAGNGKHAGEGIKFGAHFCIAVIHCMWSPVMTGV